MSPASVQEGSGGRRSMQTTAVTIGVLTFLVVGKFPAMTTALTTKVWLSHINGGVRGAGATVDTAGSRWRRR